MKMLPHIEMRSQLNTSNAAKTTWAMRM